MHHREAFPSPPSTLHNLGTFWDSTSLAGLSPGRRQYDTQEFNSPRRLSYTKENAAINTASRSKTTTGTGTPLENLQNWKDVCGVESDYSHLRLEGANGTSPKHCLLPATTALDRLPHGERCTGRRSLDSWGRLVGVGSAASAFVNARPSSVTTSTGIDEEIRTSRVQPTRFYRAESPGGAKRFLSRAEFTGSNGWKFLEASFSEAACCTNAYPSSTSWFDISQEWTTSLPEPEWRGRTEEPAASEDVKSAPKVVRFFALFRFADMFDWLLMALGSIGAIVNGGSLPWFSLLFGKLVNTIATGHGNVDLMVTEVHKTCLLMLGLAIIAFVGSYLEVACWIQAANRQATRIRTAYLRSLLRQDVSYFDSLASTGDVANWAFHDVPTVQDAIGEKLGDFIRQMATFVIGYLVGCIQSWEVSLLILGATPVTMAAVKLHHAVYASLASKERTALQEAGSLAEQAMSSIRTVYSLVAEDDLVRKYSTSLQKTISPGVRVGFARGAGIGTIYLISYSTWALILWFGAVLVAKGRLSGGAAIATFFAVSTGVKGLRQAAPFVGNFIQGKLAAGQVYSVIDRAPLIDSASLGGKVPQEVWGGVTFENVSFAYPARPKIEIFRDFSIKVRAGKTTALVGPSGSGKSTVFALLERFYDPSSGNIFLDRLDLKDLQLAWLRSQIGMVGQEPVLYSTSIGENIRYGRDGASEEAMVAAAQAANAHTFISQLPDGYNTKVGERGAQLSGGQKQRVAIARAILKNPRILLLDEATSALDSESEKVVQQAMDRMLVDRTTMVIAHRLSTIQNADEIAVLQDGRVIEMGTHIALLRKEGAYHGLLNPPIVAKVGGNVTPATVTSMVAAKSVTSPLLTMAAAADRVVQVEEASVDPARPLSPESQKRAQNAADHKVKIVRESGGGIVQGFTRLWKTSSGVLNFLLVGASGGIFSGMIFPLFGLIMGSVFALYYLPDAKKMKQQVDIRVVGAVALGGTALVSMTVQDGFFNWAGIMLAKKLRELFLESCLRQEVGWFEREENSSRAILGRLSEDAESIREIFRDRLSIVVVGVTAITVGLAICLIIQWKVTLVSIALVPLLIAPSYAGGKVQKRWADREYHYDYANSIAGESVSNIRTVASFCLEKKIVALFSQAIAVPRKQTFLHALLAGGVLGSSQLLTYSSYTFVLWYGSKLVQLRQAGLGQVIKVLFILIVSSYSAQISQMGPAFAKFAAALRSAFAVIDRRPLVDTNLNLETGFLDCVKGRLEFRKVEFSYPSRPNVAIFSAFSLTIEAGRNMALVGRSGSGKSTAIALLLRFYDPTRGNILLDGSDIRILNGKWLRTQTALVGQEPVLFATSIRNNIAFGREESTSMEQIELAARDANVHDFICSLSHGYNTQVGERGVQLSGGQKQRIAIARAIVRDPKVFLLDEPTSALDTESERKVQRALEAVTRGRTTVIVAHRLSTIRNADGVAVINNGKLEELGTHESLMQNAGPYFHLFNSQFNS